MAPVQTRGWEERWLLAGVGVAFLVCYASVLRSLAHQWATNDVYAHGFLVPLIAGYIVWVRRDRLAKVRMQPAPAAGWIVILAGLAALIAGDAGGVQVLAQLSLVITFAGLLLLLFGAELLIELRLPVFCLLFMIPIWEIFTGPLQYPFQRLSAEIGARVLRLAGIPLVFNGVLLELPDITLEVAEACSGVNFLVAILAVGIPQAWIQLASIRHRLLVVFLATAIALLTNGLRVAVIGVLAYYHLTGPEIHGPAHVLQGLSVAVIGFVALFATIQLLARRVGRQQQSTPLALDRGTDQIVRTKPALPRRLAFWSIAVLLAVTGVRSIDRATPVDAAPVLTAFPLWIGGWVGGGTWAPPAALENRGADLVIARRYQNAAGAAVHLYIGFFRFQTQDKELLNFRVSALHAQANPTELKLADGTALEANEVVREARGRREYLLFWYDLQGQRLADRFRAKAWTTWRSITRGRTDGAIVCVSMDFTRKSLQQARADAGEFARLVAATLAQPSVLAP